MGSALARFEFVHENLLSSVGEGHAVDEPPVSTGSPTGWADLGASQGPGQICQDLSSAAMRLHP